MINEFDEFEKRILESFTVTLSAQLLQMTEISDQLKEVGDRLEHLGERMGRLARMPPHRVLRVRVQPQFRLHEPRGLTWSSN